MRVLIDIEQRKLGNFATLMITSFHRILLYNPFTKNMS